MTSLLILHLVFAIGLSQKVGISVTSFKIHTDYKDPGDGSALNMTLNWNDKRYSCSINPDTINTTYSCSSSSEITITPNEYIPYFIKLEYDSPTPIQIASITITDNNLVYYTVDTFCIR